MKINCPGVCVREERETEESVNVRPKNSLFSPGCGMSCGLGPEYCAYCACHITQFITLTHPFSHLFFFV